MAVTDLIRGRQVVVTLTNSSGGSVAAGDVVILNTGANESFTTTTSAASTQMIGIAQETIANAAVGRVLVSGYAPLVNVNASVTRGRFLFTHTVAKQAAESATYGAGAFGVILTSGTTPTAQIFGATAQSGAGMSNPLTTTGDIIYSSSGTTPARLGIGSTGQVLAVVSGVPAWIGFKGCKVYKTGNQSINTATATAITFDAESFDAGGFHDNVTNNTRITIPANEGGYYLFGASLEWAANATGERNGLMKLNGTTEVQFSRATPTASSAINCWITEPFSLAAEDYMEVQGYQTTGAGLNVQGGAVSQTNFWCYKIGV